MVDLRHPDLRASVGLLNYVDPDEHRTGMVLAPDLLNGAYDRGALKRASEVLKAAVADQGTTDAELKGVLNRQSAKMWGAEFDRAFTPREFLSELSAAIDAYLATAKP